MIESLSTLLSALTDNRSVMYTVIMTSISKKVLEVRESVKKRDNNKCCVCSTSYRIQIHHRDGNTDNNDISNLMLLCEPCHKGIHFVFLRSRYNIGMSRQKKFAMAVKRAERMEKLQTKGWSLEKIAKKHNISRQRVSSILREQKIRLDKMTKDSILN